VSSGGVRTEKVEREKEVKEVRGQPCRQRGGQRRTKTVRRRRRRQRITYSPVDQEEKGGIGERKSSTLSGGGSLLDLIRGREGKPFMKGKRARMTSSREKIFRRIESWQAEKDLKSQEGGGERSACERCNQKGGEGRRTIRPHNFKKVVHKRRQQNSRLRKRKVWRSICCKGPN